MQHSSSITRAGDDDASQLSEPFEDSGNECKSSEGNISNMQEVTCECSHRYKEEEMINGT